MADYSYFVEIAKQALYLSLLLTGPGVIAALIVGLVVSILQATTQIQEQTLTFVPKLVAIAAVLTLSGSWMLSQLVAFASSLFDSFATYIH